MTLDLFFTFLLLIGLELVLGIDNVLIISILTAKLPEEQRERARRIGLFLAMFLRVVMLLFVSAMQRLTEPVISFFTGRDLILLGGGLFLIFKAVREIHNVVEGSEEKDGIKAKATTMFSVIFQILIFDAVFSLDSVITAVGLTSHIGIIIGAVIVSFLLVLLFAKAIADFVHAHPALKVLALAFLVCIGVTLFMEGMHHEVPKAYIYLPMGFALAVELLQMRYAYKHRKNTTEV